MDWIQEHNEEAVLINQEAFLSSVFSDLIWENREIKEKNETLLRSSIRAYRKNESLVIKVRSYSIEKVQEVAGIIGKEVVASHDKMISSYAEALDVTNRRVVDLENFLEQLRQIERENAIKTSLEKMLWLKLSAEAEQSLKSLKFEVARNGRTLNGQKSYVIRPTKVFSTDVSETPVFPRINAVWRLAIVGGFLLGLFLISIMAFVESSKKR